MKQIFHKRLTPSVVRCELSDSDITDIYYQLPWIISHPFGEYKGIHEMLRFLLWKIKLPLPDPWVQNSSPDHTIREVINMDKDKQEKLEQKKSNEIFNSITEKVKPENQNQTHNSRREGMGPNTKRKPM